MTKPLIFSGDKVLSFISIYISIGTWEKTYAGNTALVDLIKQDMLMINKALQDPQS